MPSQAEAFRATCGRFHSVLIYILGQKAKRYAESRVKTLRLKTRFQGCLMGFVLTLTFCGSLLMQAGDIESNPGPGRGGSSGGVGARGGATVQTRLSQSVTGSPDRASSGVGGEGSIMNEMKRLFAEFSTQQQQQHQMSTDKVLTKMNELETKINQKFDAVNTEIEHLQTEMSVLQEENDGLRTAYDELAQRVVTLEQRADDQESRSKRNNLLFFGIKRDENETTQASENKVKDILRQNLELTDNIEFDRAHRVGTKSEAPIIVKCTFYKDKLKILRNKNKLEGTQMYVKEDFPANVRHIRKILGALTKTHRDRGERVKVVYDHVYIDNKKYVLNENQDGLIETR